MNTSLITELTFFESKASDDFRLVMTAISENVPVTQANINSYFLNTLNIVEIVWRWSNDLWALQSEAISNATILF